MSLYGSIRLGANSLQANDIALQVTGQNIANANTPGYIREEVVLEPAPAQRIGRLTLGLGVDVRAVVQKVDEFLEQRLRGAISESADAETQESTYAQLEGAIGELSDTDLSTSLTNFFDSISEVLNQPGSVSVRNLAMLQGATLTSDINRLSERVIGMRKDLDDQVYDMADNINRLVEEVRVLNVRIANTEGGDASSSDAVGLRDQRLEALQGLAKLIDVRVQEQPSGGVAVYVGGDYLVFEGVAHRVEAGVDAESESPGMRIFMEDSRTPLNPAAGELRGLMTARDDVLSGFLQQLDDFSATLAFEFNKVYSKGQGLSGYNELTSGSAVDDPAAPLNDAGLKFLPVNGSFQIIARNKTTGATKTFDIRVNLSGFGDQTSLNDLQAALSTDAIRAAGIDVTVTSDNRLKVSADSGTEFAFAQDSSGVLAALGLNTFFSGFNASTLGVNAVVRNEPSTFAASQGGIGVDTKNAADLASFLDRPITDNGDTLAVLYDRMTSQVTQGSAVAQAAAEGARTYQATLQGQKTAVSGVNLDEEAVRLIAYQRAYQASARYISTLNELLGILVTL